MSQIINCKVVILGDSSTGKSSIATMYVNETFDEIQEPTIGASFLRKDLVTDRCKISYEIWDTAGQERYRSLAPMYYRNTKVALIVFDITNKDSFLSAIEWIKEIQEKCENPVIILVGNKFDLKNHIDKVLIDEYINSFNIPYFETSAKENINISEIFLHLSNYFIDFKGSDNNSVQIDTDKKSKFTKNCC